jgi:hypothetical protein
VKNLDVPARGVPSQTFPFALEAVRELAATQGKRFTVIADEAHSSKTVEAASKLKAVLSAAEQAAQNAINALVLSKRNLGAFLQVYSFRPRSSTTATPPSRNGRSPTGACCRSWSWDATARGWTCPT